MKKCLKNKGNQLSFDFEKLSNVEVLRMREVLISSTHNVVDFTRVKEKQELKIESELNRKIIDTIRHIL